MKKTLHSFVLFALLTLVNQSFAQIEQVSVGSPYVQQAYYKISTGEVTQINNDAWDIAFSNDGFTDAGIFINESASLNGSPLKLFVATTTDWNEPITDLSAFTDENILYNTEESWTEGAFNTVKNDNNPVDYGWGEYNPASHIIEGTKIYVIQKRDGAYIKFHVSSLSGGAYNFQWANLDGSNEITKSVMKDNASADKVMYFSLDTESLITIPNDYDLCFQRYYTPLDPGNGDIVDYPVLGVLLAPGTEAVVADGIDPASVNHMDYTNQYSTVLSTIGHEWKSFSFSSGWILDDDRVQFVKTRDNDIYKIEFLDFEGSSTGITTLEKTFEGNSAAVNQERPLAKDVIQVFPNPTADILNFQGINDECTVTLTNTLGQVVFRNNINTNNTSLNLSLLSEGTYVMVINGKTFHETKQIVIAK